MRLTEKKWSRGTAAWLRLSQAIDGVLRLRIAVKTRREHRMTENILPEQIRCRLVVAEGGPQHPEEGVGDAVRNQLLASAAPNRCFQTLTLSRHRRVPGGTVDLVSHQTSVQPVPRVQA